MQAVVESICGKTNSRLRLNDYVEIVTRDTHYLSKDFRLYPTEITNESVDDVITSCVHVKIVEQEQKYRLPLPDNRLSKLGVVSDKHNARV